MFLAYNTNEFIFYLHFDIAVSSIKWSLFGNQAIVILLGSFTQDNKKPSLTLVQICEV